MTYTCFNDLNHARSFAIKHFGQNNHVEHHSACANAVGQGKSAYVTIAKTQELYGAQLVQYNRDRAELHAAATTGWFISAGVKAPEDEQQCEFQRVMYKQAVENQSRVLQTKILWVSSFHSVEFRTEWYVIISV
jgi:hypothetical protein